MKDSGQEKRGTERKGVRMVVWFMTVRVSERVGRGVRRGTKRISLRAGRKGNSLALSSGKAMPPRRSEKTIMGTQKM